MNKNKTGGLLDEAKGRAKQISGRLVGNQTPEPKEKNQNVGGAAKVACGELREKPKAARANK